MQSFTGICQATGRLDSQVSICPLLPSCFSVCVFVCLLYAFILTCLCLFELRLVCCVVSVCLACLGVCVFVWVACLLFVLLFACVFVCLRLCVECGSVFIACWGCGSLVCLLVVCVFLRVGLLDCLFVCLRCRLALLRCCVCLALCVCWGVSVCLLVCLFACVVERTHWDIEDNGQTCFVNSRPYPPTDPPPYE